MLCVLSVCVCVCPVFFLTHCLQFGMLFFFPPRQKRTTGIWTCGEGRRTRRRKSQHTIGGNCGPRPRAAGREQKQEATCATSRHRDVTSGGLEFPCLVLVVANTCPNTHSEHGDGSSQCSELVIRRGSFFLKASLFFCPPPGRVFCCALDSPPSSSLPQSSTQRAT